MIPACSVKDSKITWNCVVNVLMQIVCCIVREDRRDFKTDFSHIYLHKYDVSF